MISSILENELISNLIAQETTKEDAFKNEVIKDLWLCLVSREVSLLGRREVLSGKAKFGIFGGGKEVPQVALAKSFRKGDYRAGYYRDQTWMFALGLCDVQSFLAQLYADPAHDPYSGGRQMNTHFASPFLDEHGHWLNQTDQYNISADISCTAGQMGRALGLAMASKKFRNVPDIENMRASFGTGDEICFSTIGDASTSEGAFWEVMNAACIGKVPLMMSVWDDGYGISVPVKYQTTKASISRAMEGFLRDEQNRGMDIYTVKAWDYPELCVMYDRAAKKMRKEHMPALVHVQECTQPQGHSTSGSHERYKSKERLEWEKEYDCIRQFSMWAMDQGIIDENDYLEMREEAKVYVRKCKKEAWNNYRSQYTKEKTQITQLLENAVEEHPENPRLEKLYQLFKREPLFNDREISILARRAAYYLPDHNNEFLELYEKVKARMHENYGTHLYATGETSALNVPVIDPIIPEDAPMVNGFEVINIFFDRIFEKMPNVLAFGEDVGHIGDVNQGFAGLQDKYGHERIYDSGIREWTIVGQAIGMALRGLRPIAEIQYLDYALYGLTPLSDDLATLRYRSDNQQAAPVIIRTRGHRLEGIWHTGSPMGLMVNALKGIYICVPRNLSQAAGMYNTMLQSMDPAMIVEPLNGYRIKEKMPSNIGEYTIPLGVPEVINEGDDVTLVTYGSCVRIAQKALQFAEYYDISVELIDARTLVPFDLEGIILNSLKKTNRIIFMDEDVPGGATAYMVHKVIEESEGYRYLDMKPVTLTAKEHRSPYGSDGDYYTKPQVEDVFEAIYKIVFEEPII